MEMTMPKTYTDMIGENYKFNGNLFNKKDNVDNEEFKIMYVRFSSAFIINLRTRQPRHPAIEFLLKNDKMKRSKWSRPFPCREIELKD